MGVISRDSEVRKLVKRSDYHELVNRHLEGEAIVPEIMSLLEDGDADVRESAAMALAWMGERNRRVAVRAIPGLISVLKDKDGNVRGSAAMALGRIGEKNPEAVRQAIPRLIGSLKDRSKVVRGSAAQALGMIEVAEALEKLRGLLSDSGKLCVYGKWMTVGEVAREAIERIEKR